MEKNNSKTGKAFIGVSIVIFISKLLGFARDIVFAFIFGTTVLTDIFQVIFSFPSLLFSSIGTALSSVNIPDLTYFVNYRSQKERNRYIANLLAQLTLAGTGLSLVGIIFAPAITQVIAPGLSGQVVDIAVLLTRIMMPTLLFVSLAYVTAGILQVHGYFMLSSMISIPFNFLIILALAWRGNDIIFLGYVTTIGWLMQFLIQLPILSKEKYRLFLGINFKNEKTRNTFRQLLPILMGNSLLQLCLIMDRSFATHLGAGATAALAFGSNLFMTITSVFVVAMSTVVFPRLSKYCLDQDFSAVRALLSNIFKILLFILLPYLLLVIFYHQEIIALVYQRGAFTSQSTSMTMVAFLCYSFAVVGYACQEIFNRVYYALKKFMVPMTVSIFCLTVHLCLNYLLFRSYGITGISLSTAFCLLLYAVIMAYLLRREIGRFLDSSFFPFCLRLLLPLGVMLVIMLLFGNFKERSVLAFLLPMLISGSAYLLGAYICGINKGMFLKEVSLDE